MVFWAIKKCAQHALAPDASLRSAQVKRTVGWLKFCDWIDR